MENKNEDDIVGVWLNLKIDLRNTDGIFDKSSKIKCFNVFIIMKSCFIARTENNKIKCYDQQSFVSHGENILFKINYSGVKASINNPTLNINMEQSEENINLINNNIWYVVNSEDKNGVNENDDYYLSENDIIKFGKVKYIVKEIHFENKSFNNDNNVKIFNTNYICKEHKECEYCKGLMVRLCDCKEFEHFQCIKDWINNRILPGKENKLVKSYYFSIFQCKEYIYKKCKEEKCEKKGCCKRCYTYYPLRFKLNENDNSFKDFYEIKIPEKCDYLILESLTHQDKTSNSPKIEKDIHVIKLTEENITLGRDKTNHAILPDSSICKEHSVIKYIKDKGKLLLKNKSKKTGTLVLIKETTIDLSEKEKYFQKDKTFISARLIKKKEVKNLIKDLKDNEMFRIVEL